VFRFASSNGYSFISGNFPLKESDNELYQFPAGAIDEASYAILGKLRQYSINVKGGIVDVAIAPGEFTTGDKAIVKWIDDAARSISSYYNDFPIRRVLVIVRPVSGSRVSYASTLGNGGAAICVQVGRDARPTTLAEDWIMTHELVHCMFPSVPRGRHAWAEEGLATYVEPWARVRTGLVTPEEAWKDLLRDLPQGVPDGAFRGLDYTATWSNVYWSGALFYFLADVEIRQRTQNRYGLDDALRGIAAAGGTVNVDWDILRTFAAGDRAVGVPVLTELYKQMRDSSFEVNLEDFWKKLGVERRGNSIIFNDRASWANIRQAITTGKTRLRPSTPEKLVEDSAIEE
jgi:hypothetical protein